MVDAKKSPKKAAATSHPPYAQMITDAITGIGGKFRDQFFQYFKTFQSSIDNRFISATILISFLITIFQVARGLL